MNETNDYIFTSGTASPWMHYPRPVEEYAPSKSRAQEGYEPGAWDGREQFVTQYSDMLGKTMEEVWISDDRTLMRFISRRWVWEFCHEQECCESVEIIDVIGELDDLVGAPIYMAEEVVSQEENPDGVEGPDPGDRDESYTWTFYKFATIKGYVTIRWYGESNGYYSERVDVRKYTRTLA